MIKLTGSKKKGWVVRKDEKSVMIGFTWVHNMFFTHEELLALKKLLDKKIK